ncbi:MAG: manganese efflux pump [Clostridia bacterium]|nr:manganese efflux pump [Clostridia bacterium]MBR5713296.1 manganese efflux pump [Clostridia bacterium]
MDWNAVFFLQSMLLGVGLAMDAFSVSLANGLNEPGMKAPRMCGIAGVFAGFQALMPMLGWFIVMAAVNFFGVLEKYIPWAALIMLSVIGGKMLYEGIHNRDNLEEKPAVGIGGLLVQGIATSIDALSVGFTIAEYDVLHAIVCALLIAAVTFIICMIGLVLGKKVGTRLAWKASVLGGAILIAIGIEIFISGMIG